MYLCVCLSVHVCTMYMQCQRSQKRVLDPLELELKAVVSHYVGARNQTVIITTEPPPQVLVLERWLHEAVNKTP